MKILSYKAKSVVDDHHCFSEVNFNTVNLMVGDSGMGKSMFLNTIFNAALTATQNTVKLGSWDIVFRHENQTYRWIFEAEHRVSQSRVRREVVNKISDDYIERLIYREGEKFIFMDQELPKLSSTESGISLLKEESEIQPIHNGFSLFLKRDFSGPDLDRVTRHQNIDFNQFSILEKEKDIKKLFFANIGLSGKLFFLSGNFKSKFQEITLEFRRIFPFVKSTDLLQGENFSMALPGNDPVFSLREENRDDWVPLWRFSSGMKKVLLILTDLALLPASGGVYLLDEYENSLGMSAINLLPTSFLQFAPTSQLILTSHHPYIINQIPVRDWYVFHRKGNDIRIKQGGEMEAKFGHSHQDTFVQLLNDDFYNDGIE